MITDLNSLPGVLFVQEPEYEDATEEPAILIQRLSEGDVIDLQQGKDRITLDAHSLNEFIKALRQVKAMDEK